MRLLFVSLFVASVNALWPIPRHLTTGTSPLLVDKDAFSIDVSGIQGLPSDLGDAVSRTQEQLFKDNLGRLVSGRGASDKPLLATAPSLKSLKLSLLSDSAQAKDTADCNVSVDFNSAEGEGEAQIYERTREIRDLCALQRRQDNQSSSSVKSIAEETALPVEKRDESYILKIPSDGSAATLAANTTLGLLRGLTTFGQIWYQYENSVYSIEAPFDIRDAPYYVSTISVSMVVQSLERLSNDF